MRVLSYINAFRNVYKEIKVQKKFNRQFLVPYLEELEKKYDGKFYSEQKKKIERVLWAFITSFLCSSYKRLSGQSLTVEERKRATLFGILTPVGDDLFDIDKLSYEDISAITFHPEQFNAVFLQQKWQGKFNLTCWPMYHTKASI